MIIIIRLNMISSINSGQNKFKARELKKYLMKSNFKLIVLYLLLKKPMCGFEVIQEMYNKCNVFISPGTVYPFLYSLRDKGIVKSEDGRKGKRKIYHLTEEGKQVAKSIMEDIYEDIQKLYKL